MSRPSQRSLEDALLTVQLSHDASTRSGLAAAGKNRFFPRLWIDRAPTPSEWRNHNRSLAAALVYHDDNFIGAKLMLTAGRAAEVVSVYDGPIGVLGVRRGVPVQMCQLHEAALVALALKAAGRTDEATDLLRDAENRARATYRLGALPNWFDEDVAAVWAVQGKKGEAIEALSRAMRRGWLHAGRLDLASIGDEPAFRPSSGDSRFEALLRKYEQHYAKERIERRALVWV